MEQAPVESTPTEQTPVESTPTEQTPVEPTPDILTLADLLGERDVLLAKEAADKATLETIGSQSTSTLKPKLIEWVIKGYPNAYPILSVAVQVPGTCSDSVVRSLPDYIAFCSGKTINEHVALLQAKFPDIVVSFSYDGVSISIVVSKA
jgi:hypothetical protein